MEESKMTNEEKREAVFEVTPDHDFVLSDYGKDRARKIAEIIADLFQQDGLEKPSVSFTADDMTVESSGFSVKWKMDWSVPASWACRLIPSKNHAWTTTEVQALIDASCMLNDPSCLLSECYGGEE